MDFKTVFQPFLWSFFKLFLALAAFAILLGLIAGIFTYGRPLKKRKGATWMDDFADAGITISHLLIGLIVRKFKGSRGNAWLSDQEIIAMLRGMHPNEFEDYVARMFEGLGYRTRVIGGSGDGGIDIEMIKDARKHLVQCKKFITRNVTPRDVREFYGAMGDQHINGKGFFVTTNIYTIEAEQFAEGKPMELIDGARLIQLVRKSGILGAQKQPLNKSTDRLKAEHCPNCGGELVTRINRKTGNQFKGCSNFPKCKFTKPSV